MGTVDGHFVKSYSMEDVIDEAFAHVDMLDAIDEAMNHVEIFSLIDEAMDHVEILSAIDEALDRVHHHHRHHRHHSTSVICLSVAGALSLIGGAGYYIKNQMTFAKSDVE